MTPASPALRDTMTLRDSLSHFLAERRALGYAEIGTHERTLGLLLRLVSSRLVASHLVASRLAATPPEPLTTDVTREDLTNVLDVLVRRGLSPITVGHACSSFRVFFRWVSRRGALLLNPAEDLVVMRSPRRIGYVPSPSEVERLLLHGEPRAVLKRAGELDESERERVVCQAVRDLAILEILYGSGLRISEVLKLLVKDVDLGERTAFLKSAKGGKDRVVPLTRRGAEAVARYLDEARPVLLSGATADHESRKTPEVLFLSASGTRLYHDWRERSFVPIARAAGLPSALTPHRLRHACAVHLLSAGADLTHIARLLGHERLDTTALYLALSTKSVAEALERAHPRERRSEGDRD